MKKIEIFLSIFLFTSNVALAQTVFTDDFSGSLNAWTDMYGEDWSIQNNELHGFYSLSCGNPGCTQADLILKDQYQIDDYWKASIDFIRVVDDEFSYYYAAAAIFSLWTDFDHKIKILVGGGGEYWQGNQDSIWFGVEQWDGSWSVSLYSTNKVKFDWNPDEWHTASLEKRGNKYSVFVDDACIAHYIDNYLDGEVKVGLHNYGTRRLDNFKLEPIYCYTQFEDDFSGTLSAWTDMYGGNWSILNNELHGFFSLGCGSPTCTQADLILKDQYQIDGNFKASIDFTRVVDDAIPYYYAAAAVFSLWKDYDHKVKILVGYGGENWDGLQDSISFGVEQWDGSWSNSISSTHRVRYLWDPNQWHTASLEKRGNIYSVFVDDACIAHYIDDFLNGEGKIGMHTYGTRRLDNFLLETCSNTNTGVTENSTSYLEYPIKLFPNPTTDLLSVQFKPNTSDCEVLIYDSQGRLIKKQNVNFDKKTIDVKGLEPGIYVLKIQADRQTLMSKFIKL